jgi:hypothetical protein
MATECNEDFFGLADSLRKLHYKNSLVGGLLSNCQNLDVTAIFHVCTYKI